MRHLLAIVLAALALAACGGPEGRWDVAQIDGKPYAPSPRHLHVEFDHGEMSAETGCNGAWASYFAFAGHLWWTSRMSSHAMLCTGQRVMQLEGQLTQWLAQTTTYERVGQGMILRTDTGRSLTLQPAPPVRQLLEGDWVLNSVFPSHGGWSMGPRPWITFHNGVVTDSAGCVGRYRRDGARFALDYQPSPSCAAAIARTPPPHPESGKWFDDVDIDPADAFFVRMQVVGIDYPGRWDCSAPELIGANGMKVWLEPATGADFVPRSAWTLDGAWTLPGENTPSVTFDHGAVEVTDGCSGRYTRDGVRLMLDLPAACLQRVRARDAGRPYVPLTSVAGPVKLWVYDYADISLSPDHDHVYALRRVMPPQMTRPHQSCN